MKRLVLIVLVAANLLFGGCSAKEKVDLSDSSYDDILMNKKVEWVEVSKTKDYDTWNANIDKVFMKKDEINLFVKALKQYAQPGILPDEEDPEMSDSSTAGSSKLLPDYDIKVAFNDQSAQVYKVWIPQNTDAQINYSRMEWVDRYPGVIRGDRAKKIKQLIQ